MLRAIWDSVANSTCTTVRGLFFNRKWCVLGYEFWQHWFSVYFGVCFSHLRIFFIFFHWFLESGRKGGREEEGRETDVRETQGLVASHTGPGGPKPATPYLPLTGNRETLRAKALSTEQPAGAVFWCLKAVPLWSSWSELVTVIHSSGVKWNSLRMCSAHRLMIKNVPA